jgi:hypothetical protein
MKRAVLAATLLVLVLAGTGCSRVAAVTQPTQPVTVTFVAHNVDPEVSANLKVGDALRLKDTGGAIGKIASLETSKSIQAVPTSQGSLVATASPLTDDVTITVETNGVVDDSGIRVAGVPFFINDSQKLATSVVQFTGEIVGLKTASK